MATLGLNHYNLRADHALMEKLRDFYCDIVGLAVGFRPPFGSHGYWLYAGEQAVLHLSTTAASAGTTAATKSSPASSGAAVTTSDDASITRSDDASCATSDHASTATFDHASITTFDHAAFSCTGLAEFEYRLTQQAIQYRVARVPQTGQVQIFLRDPAGNGVELNFANG